MKMIGVYIVTALRQLLKNKGRSVLTMLGIIIGIGSVIFILTTGEIAKSFLLGQIQQFGTNVIEVAPPGTFGLGESDEIVLTEDDVELMLNSQLLPEIEAVSAGKTKLETFEYNGEEQNVSVFADRPEVFSVNNFALVDGRTFNSADMNNTARVTVIGKAFAEETFTTAAAAIGEEVKIGGSFFTIIGVIDEGTFGGFGSVPFMYMPITTARNLFIDPAEVQEVSFLLIQFEQGSDTESLRQRVIYELKRSRDLLDREGDIFTVVSREAALDIFNSVLIGIQAFISAVAAISLLVGGIGIMNIMLVTVKERTKEIGLRKAIGARNSSILIQFLVESVVLTTVGGIIGIAIGLGLSILAVIGIGFVFPDFDVQFVFVPNAIFLATGVAAVVGIVFGLYPAVKASKLAPIEALRYE